MRLHARAGQPADPAELVNVPRLMTAYYTGRPDPQMQTQRVAFGTSGHRGSSFDRAFNEGHILAITAGHLSTPRAAGHRRPAVPRHRYPRAVGARASPARSRCWPRNGVEVMLDAADGYTPTPAVSHAILTYNRGRTQRARRRHRDHAVAQPARPTAASSTTRRTAARPTTAVTGWIQDQANALLEASLQSVQRMPLRARPARARPRTGTTTSTPTSATSRACSTWTPSAAPASASASIRWAAPACAYWEPIAERYGLDLEVVNRRGRSHVPLHDRRLGRQDPHGPVVAVRHGSA